MCSSYYLIAPALSWDAILNRKYWNAILKLKLIPDSDIFIFFEKSKTDGVFYVSNRYNKANNKYLKSYDPKQESKHIIHLDRIIYMVVQCISLFQQVDSNG